MYRWVIYWSRDGQLEWFRAFDEDDVLEIIEDAHLEEVDQAYILKVHDRELTVDQFLEKYQLRYEVALEVTYHDQTSDDVLINILEGYGPNEASSKKEALGVAIQQFIKTSCKADEISSIRVKWSRLKRGADSTGPDDQTC